MIDLKCEYVVIDMVSSLGTKQNVIQHVTKYYLDAVGVRDQLSLPTFNYLKTKEKDTVK